MRGPAIQHGKILGQTLRPTRVELSRMSAELPHTVRIRHQTHSSILQLLQTCPLLKRKLVQSSLSSRASRTRTPLPSAARPMAHLLLLHPNLLWKAAGSLRLGLSVRGHRRLLSAPRRHPKLWRALGTWRWAGAHFWERSSRHGCQCSFLLQRAPLRARAASGRGS